MPPNAFGLREAMSSASFAWKEIPRIARDSARPVAPYRDPSCARSGPLTNSANAAPEHRSSPNAFGPTKAATMGGMSPRAIR